MKKRILPYIASLAAALFLLAGISLPAQAHWTSKGPYGGTVTCFTVVDTTLYVGTEQGGVFRSLNKNATSWKVLNNPGLTNGNITALGSIGSYVIAGTTNGAIFISKDMGATWTSESSSLNHAITSMATLNGRVYAGFIGGDVYVSTDSGFHWAAATNGALNQKKAESMAVAGNTLYVGTNDGMYMTNDDGKTWQSISTNFHVAAINSLTVLGNQLYAGTSSGVYATDMSSISWTTINPGLTSTTSVYSITGRNDTLYAITASGIYATPTTIIKWQQYNTGLAETKVNTLVTFNDKVFAGMSSSGIYMNSPSGWKVDNIGFNNLSVRIISISGNVIVAATPQGLLVSRDLAANYYPANKGLGSDSLRMSCGVFNGDTLYAVSGVKLYTSIDTGRNWTLRSSNLPTSDIVSMIITNGKIFISGEYDIYMSSLGSMDFKLIKSGIKGRYITAMQQDSNNIYTSVDSAVYVLNDTSWSRIGSPLPSGVMYMTVLKGYVYAVVYQQGVYVCNVANPSWVAMNNGLPTKNIESICAHYPYVVVGYQGGVYETNSQGRNWVSPNVLLYIPPFADVRQIAFANGRVFITTPNNSLYSNAISELPADIEEVNTTAQSHIRISPNPNSGRFRLLLEEQADKVNEVAVYDISGRLVQRFSSPAQGAELDMGNCQKGIYLLHISTRQSMAVQKIVVE